MQLCRWFSNPVEIIDTDRYQWSCPINYPRWILFAEPIKFLQENSFTFSSNIPLIEVVRIVTIIIFKQRFSGLTYHLQVDRGITDMTMAMTNMNMVYKILQIVPYNPKDSK